MTLASSEAIDRCVTGKASTKAVYVWLSIKGTTMIDQTISHYKVLQKIGEGGMGVAYRGEDANLGCSGALKVFPAHVVLT